ncbi:hypothetical protein BGZ52_010175, partial [Haplosporangium bisporale]
MSINSLGNGGGGGGVVIRHFGAQGSTGVSLFGGAGTSAARMRTKTESPLFETEEDEESRETEELLASEGLPTPTSEFEA